MIDLKLNWFAQDGPVPEVPEDPDVPDIPGIGGVLSVYGEYVDDTATLRASWKEIKRALDKGWVVPLITRTTFETFSELIDGAGYDGTFYYVTSGEVTYRTEDPDGILTKVDQGGDDSGGGDEGGGNM